MKQKKLLALTLSQLRQLYRNELPELDALAARSGDEAGFRRNLTEYLENHPQAESEACRQIRLLASTTGRQYTNSPLAKICPSAPYPCSIVF